MKLILQKDVKNLGKTGDQVSVKDGFARNFLLPKGYALLLNKNRLKAWNHQKTIITTKKRKAIAERKALIERLSSIKLVFEKESQKDNKIFGSVTAHEISQTLEEQYNISVDKRDIHFSELKTVGDHKISIRLDSECQTEILLTIKGKIRKKRTAVIKKTDQETELISKKAEIKPLPEMAEAEEAVSIEEPAPVSPDKVSVEENPEQKAEETASFSKIKSEESQKSVSVKSEQAMTHKTAALSSDQTASTQSTESPSRDSETVKSKKQGESESDIQTATDEKQESSVEDSGKQGKSKAQKEQKTQKAEDQAKSLSQNNSQSKPESKKPGGLFKSLFGKK